MLGVEFSWIWRGFRVEHWARAAEGTTRCSVTQSDARYAFGLVSGAVEGNVARLLERRRLGVAAEPLQQDAVPQPAVTHGQLVSSQLVHDRSHDARARENDLGALGLQPDDLPSLLRRVRAIQLDLPVHFTTSQC